MGWVFKRGEGSSTFPSLTIVRGDTTPIPKMGLRTIGVTFLREVDHWILHTRAPLQGVVSTTGKWSYPFLLAITH